MRESAGVLVMGAARTVELLPFDRLVPALRAAFAKGRTAVQTPHRQQHRLDEERNSSLLIMPAWNDEFLGVKLVTVFPANRPAVSSTYLLSDARTGENLASLDGTTLTSRRTAAASALAASYLARPDASTLLVIGSGAVASLLPDAYREVRDLKRVLVHSRTTANARRLADRIGGEVVDDLPAAVAEADIVSCATLATSPVVLGDWVRPGTHIDLIGGFTPDMREADDALVSGASLFVDSRAACEEAGDLTQPLASGLISRDDLLADLVDLCTGTHPGRTDDHQVTLFKSAGTAVEDLAAAVLAYTSR